MDPELQRRIQAVIAGLPGVGQGMLDTLQALSPRPLAFDTTSAPGAPLGEAQRGAERDRVVLNLAELGNLQGRRQPFLFGDQPAAGTLAHEVIGHLLERAPGTAAGEEGANRTARAFLRLSGRGDALSPMTPEEIRAFARVRELLEQRMPPDRLQFGAGLRP